MLQLIKITKLFGRFNYELSFSSEGIMIITGPNGYGKSTILRIIECFCNYRIEKVLSNMFEELVIECANSSIRIVKKLKTFMINSFEFPYPDKEWDKRHGSAPFIERMIDDDYIEPRMIDRFSFFGGSPRQLSIWKDEPNKQAFAFSILGSYEGEFSSKRIKKLIEDLDGAFSLIGLVQKEIGRVRFIKEQRLIEKREIREDERRYNRTRVEYVTVIHENSEKLKAELAEIMKKHSALSSNLDSTYIKRLFEADQSQLDSVEPIKERLKELQGKQDKLQKYGLAEIQNASYLNQLDQEKLNKFGIELSIYLEDAYAKYQVFEPIIDKLELYERVINEKLTFKKMFLSSSDGIVVKTDENTALSLNDLSSGEQEILVLFYKLIFESDVNLLLIDEPEISLHIAWQKELMENLKSIVSLKKNIQVIIATHSPQIISHNWDLQIDLGGLHNG